MAVSELARTHRACPMCGCIHMDVIYHYQDEFMYFEKLPREFDVVSCKECGFVYSDILASQEIYDEYYSQFSVYDNLGVTYGMVSEDDPMNVYARRAEEIARFSRQTDSILEIGSANGFLLEELKKLGFQHLSALDLSQKSLDNLAQRGFDTHLGGIFSNGAQNQSHPPLSEQFDCVCLTQVMEHIYDIHGAMQNIKRMLKPGGCLYIEVPDAGRFQEFEESPYGFFNFEHIEYFDERSLQSLSVQNGFETVGIYHKDIRFSTKQELYPVIAGVFRRPLLIKSKCDLALKRYAAMSEKKMHVYVDKVRSCKGELALWGMGTFARQLLKRLDGIRDIQYLIDSNPLHEGKQLFKRRIGLPKELVKNNFSGTILITTSLYADEVVAQIEALHLDCSYRVLNAPADAR